MGIYQIVRVLNSNYEQMLNDMHNKGYDFSHLIFAVGCHSDDSLSVAFKMNALALEDHERQCRAGVKRR